MMKRHSNTFLYKRHLTLLYIVMAVMSASAQMNRTVSPLVHTLQTIVNDDWMQPNTITLDSDDFVTISFDHFSHEYHRFCCHLVHCDADWSPSELMESEYMEGFNDRPIEDYVNSLNTTFLYTHYKVCYPNDDVLLKVSGNYRVLIYDDESDLPSDAGSGEQPFRQYKGHPVVAVAHFRVVDAQIVVKAEVTSNTDIDTYASHQQVSFIISHAGYTIERPERELKVFVDQNNRPELTVSNIQPTYIRPERLEYVHNRSLIFLGNNEFRRFEVFNLHYGWQHVDKIDFYEPYYHAVLLPDDERRAYSFDADHNGRFLVRYNQAVDSDTEADYFFAHFSLHLPYPLQHGKVYVTGLFSNYSYTDEYEMTYNPATRNYEGIVLMKMGAYDYQYVFVPDADSRKEEQKPIDGSFYETENEYTVSVYHRPFGSRYDQLVAVEQVTFSQE